MDRERNINPLSTAPANLPTKSLHYEVRTPPLIMCSGSGTTLPMGVFRIDP